MIRLTQLTTRLFLVIFTALTPLTGQCCVTGTVADDASANQHLATAATPTLSDGFAEDCCPQPLSSEHDRPCPDKSGSDQSGACAHCHALTTMTDTPAAIATLGPSPVWPTYHAPVGWNDTSVAPAGSPRVLRLADWPKQFTFQGISLRSLSCLLTI